MLRTGFLPRASERGFGMPYYAVLNFYFCVLGGLSTE